MVVVIFAPKVFRDLNRNDRRGSNQLRIKKKDSNAISNESFLYVSSMNVIYSVLVPICEYRGIASKRKGVQGNPYFPILFVVNVKYNHRNFFVCSNTTVLRQTKVLYSSSAAQAIVPISRIIVHFRIYEIKCVFQTTN